jgi:PAS domain S-box-containing protein
MFRASALDADFMPHGMCYLWRPDLLALHAVSDGLIALAYLSIPFTLLYVVRKRRDLQFTGLYLCFGLFIIACGVTHLIEIWTIWHPAYWVSGGIKAVTAGISLLTAALLIKNVPRALRLPSPTALQRVNADLAREVADRRRAEEELRIVNESLEQRVADRTAQLGKLTLTLIQDNARFALAADAAGLGFWRFDVGAQQLHWDETMFRLYGRSELSGEQPYSAWAESLHPDDRERSEQELRDALADRKPFETEFRIVHPGGEVRFLRAVARITRDADGGAVRMFGVNFDVTELRRADERFRLAIDAAPTGMLLMNRSGAIELANAQIEKLFGYTRSELLGRQIETLIPERFRHRHPEFRKGFFGEPRARSMGAGRDLYGLRKDGSEVPIEIGLNPLNTSDGEFVLSSIVDLSQRREIDRMRTDFVSTVSHELRTPLTSISASLALLQSGVVGKLPEEAGAMVRIAHKNSERLVRIINDILDIGRLEQGMIKLRLQRVAVASLLHQSIEANSSYADKYGVRFVFDDGESDDLVEADPDRLMQVITNLLSNAAKFSAPGSDVRVRLRPEAAMITVEVDDAGPGIPEAFKERVFEKFAQADASASRAFEGTGLGLSIAKQLIEAMHGTIGFRPSPARGTIFYFTLRRVGAQTTLPVA